MSGQISINGYSAPLDISDDDLARLAVNVQRAFSTAGGIWLEGADDNAGGVSQAQMCWIPAGPIVATFDSATLPATADEVVLRFPRQSSDAGE